MTKNIGFILLAIYLLMLSIGHFGILVIPTILLGIVAGAAAIFILVGR